MVGCFAWLSSASSVKPDVLIIGAVGALGAAEALREFVGARIGALRARGRATISYSASAQSAPPLAATLRLREAEKAHSWLTVDGYFGPESARALQVLLTRNGMNTGKIDGVFGTKSKRAFQEFLRGRGYDVGKIDGFFGPRSVMALQSWLRDSGFSPKGPGGGTIDGIWGAVTTRSLQQTLNTELGKSSPSSRSTTASSSTVTSPGSPITPQGTEKMRRTNSGRATLNSLDFVKDAETPKTVVRRTKSLRGSKEVIAAGAA
jgi:peptidoglycan hydrolase-like protein with peptidoglycan-binding domain